MNKDSNPGTSDVQVYGRLLSYVLPYWPAFFLSVAGFVIYSVANVSFLQLVGYIVDSLGGNDPLADSLIVPYIRQIFGEDAALNRSIIPLAIVLIVILRGMGTFIGNYFITYVGTSLVHNLRIELFDRLLVLPSRFYDRNAMGHLVAKITFHVNQVTGAATDAVKVIIREGFTVLGYLGYLFYLNWKLTLIFIAVAPFIAVLVSYAGKRFRRISERIQDSMGDVTHVASETIQGYKEVRTFGGADYERHRFESVSNNNRRQSMRMVITSSVATPVIQVVVSLALATLVWLALNPLLLSSMSPGDVVAFIVTGGLLAKPIRQLSEVNATVQRGLAAAEDIFDLFDEETETDEGDQELDVVNGKLEFRGVSFSYDRSKETVLKDVSFVAEPGETIALVGRSGSGKSTLASLIPRFYSPDSGLILLDDKPIADIKLINLRQHMAIVTQNVTLFNDTVSKNIAYGALRSSSEVEIQNAAEKAHAWSFIKQLEHGLETVVGDDGVLLSGGQRQRLAIARAFLKDAPVLILDEATSALDSESERYIQYALEAVTEGRTTIVIAHRLSTIEKADRILVIDDGRIVEQGSHQDLLKNGKHYADLHNLRSESDEAEVPIFIKPDFKPVLARREARVRWLTDNSNPLTKGWYQKHSWVKLLAPLSLLYSGIAVIRRRRTKPWKAPVPVIIVGNINIGGTGKTPLVAWLAEQLLGKGHHPGIVGRGYGGKAIQYPLEVTALSDPAVSGDEAVMLVRKTGCPVVIDPDRPAAVRYLLDNYGCDVVLSDDGLQHYALDRDVEIVVIDSMKGLGNGLCLPAGPLREPVGRLNEVDIVVTNGTDEITFLPSQAERNHMRMNLVPAGIKSLTTGEVLKESLGSKTVHGVAGIGNPDRFFDTLREVGYEVIEHRFEDHHRFELADLSFGDSLPVVMTEKDATKCRLLNPGLIHQNFWYLSVEVEISNNFLAAVLSKIGMNVSELKAIGN